jgi:hypothetical protein
MSAGRLITIVAALSLIVASCAKDTAGPGPQEPPPGNNPPPPPPPPPGNAVTLYAAGNITACQPGDHDFAVAGRIRADTGQWAALALGDMALQGSLNDFTNCYHASWGPFKERTYPVLGNHEYDYWELIPGAPPPADTIRKANGSFEYWGAKLGGNGAGGRGGYYAFDYGAWRIIVINDNWNRCSTGDPGGTDNCAEAVHAGPGSQYFNWIRDELVAAQNANKCTLAAFHAPRFMSSTSAGFTVRSQRASLWEILEPNGVDVVLNGQEHHYERMAPMDWQGAPNETKARQFNVGTGGESITNEAAIVAIHPSSEMRIHRYGVLRLSLETAGYKWEFLPDDGSAALDSGSGTCH